VVKFIRRNGGPILTLLASLLLATFGLLDVPWRPWAVLLGAMSALGSVLVESRKRDRVRELESVIGTLSLAKDDALESANLLKGVCARSANEALAAISCMCSGDPTTVRASVFEREDTHWHRIARYSRSAAFRDGGRTQIPLREGLLHRALERSVAEGLKLPDRDRAPLGYEKDQVRLGLPPGQSALLTMPSRSYAVFILAGSAAEAASRTFALCVESTDPEGVVLRELKPQLDEWLPALHSLFSGIENASLGNEVSKRDS
jgi:hypothetical protein